MDHDDEATRPGPDHETRTTVRSGAHRLAVHSTGAGPDIVFVHGWPLDGRTWRHVVGALADHRCHVIDLPGCGATETPDDAELSMVEGHTTAVLDVVDALGLEEYVLVGQDSGGLIARYCAARRPERLRGLVVAGSEIPHDHGWQIKMFKALGRTPFAETVLRRSLASRLLRRSPFALGGTVADRRLLDGELHELMLRPLVRDRALLRRQVALLRSFGFDDIDGLAEIHPQIDAPTLLVWGAGDPFFPPDRAAAMVDQFGGPTEMVVVDHARLLVHEEHPEHFAHLIRTFLDERTRPTRAGARSEVTGPR